MHVYNKYTNIFTIFVHFALLIMLCMYNNDQNQIPFGSGYYIINKRGTISIIQGFILVIKLHDCYCDN